MENLETLVVETERLHIEREFTFGDHLELIRMENPETGVEYAVMTRTDFDALLSETVSTVSAHPELAKLFYITPKTNKRTAGKTNKHTAAKAKKSVKKSVKAKAKKAAA